MNVLAMSRPIWGAWIEIAIYDAAGLITGVAPHMGRVD